MLQLGVSSPLIGTIQSICSTVILSYPCIDRIALTVFEPSVSNETCFQPWVVYELGACIPEHEVDVRTLSFPAFGSTKNGLFYASSKKSESNTSFEKSQACSDCRSNFVQPFYFEGKLVAAIYFSASDSYLFGEEIKNHLMMASNLVEQKYCNHLQIKQGIKNCVRIISDLMHARDLETGQHLDRISAYSKLIAEKARIHFNLSDEHIRYIQLFACIHDIGKVGIPDSILLKKDKLTPDERKQIQRHVQIGEAILESIDSLITQEFSLANSIMHNIVSGHHERGDGSGYPRGLIMKQISAEARIVAVADVFDALASRRSYKEPWPFQVIKDELRSQANRNQLDPICVEALLSDEKSLELIQHCFSDDSI